MANIKPDKTLKELKAELVELGLPAEEVDNFNTKAQVTTILNTLKSKQAVEVVEKVASLEDKESVQEKKQFEKQYLSKAAIMRDKLLSQPLVRILVPPETNEKQGQVEWRTDKNGQKYQVHLGGSVKTIQMNGFKYMVPKGVYTDVPQQIADHIEEQQRATSTAGASIILDRTDPATGRPMKEVL